MDHHPLPVCACVRIHFENHESADCDEFCSPEKMDDPLLWHRDEADTPRFNWCPRVVKTNKAFLDGTCCSFSCSFEESVLYPKTLVGVGAVMF